VWGEMTSYNTGHMLVMPHTTGVILCTHLVWSPAPPVQGGRPPLWTACKEGHATAVELLLKAGADPNKGSDYDVRGLEQLFDFVFLLIFPHIYLCQHVTSPMG
jgi:hypothetical protein